MKDCFGAFYAKEVAEQLKNSTLENVKEDLSLSKVKLHHARWLIKAFDELALRQDIVKQGFDIPGLLQAFNHSKDIIENDEYIDPEVVDSAEADADIQSDKEDDSDDEEL